MTVTGRSYEDIPFHCEVEENTLMSVLSRLKPHGTLLIQVVLHLCSYSNYG